MKKFIVCLLFFLLIGTVGCEPVHFRIVGIRLTSVEQYDAYVAYLDEWVKAYRPTDEFKDRVAFEMSLDIEEDYAANLYMNISSACYAFQPGEVWDNELLEDSYSMTLDKPFIYLGQTVDAGVDILQHPVLREHLEIGNNSRLIIESDDEFVQNASFDSEPYTVTFSCRTSDNKSLQADTTVKFPSGTGTE